MAVWHARQGQGGSRGKCSRQLASRSLLILFPQFPQGLKVVSRNDDFCVLDEDNPESEGVYVDLYENPERFTGYAGPSANKVWKAIYEENCFDVVPFLPPSRAAESGGSGYVGSSLIQDKSQGVRNLMGTLGLAAPSDPQDEMCLEKRVYYRVISGRFASPACSTRLHLTRLLSRLARVHFNTHLRRVPRSVDRSMAAKSRVLYHAHRRAPRTVAERLLQLRPHAARSHKGRALPPIIRLRNG